MFSQSTAFAENARERQEAPLSSDAGTLLHHLRCFGPCEPHDLAVFVGWSGCRLNAAMLTLELRRLARRLPNQRLEAVPVEAPPLSECGSCGSPVSPGEELCGACDRSPWTLADPEEAAAALLKHALSQSH